MAAASTIEAYIVAAPLFRQPQYNYKGLTSADWEGVLRQTTEAMAAHDTKRVGRIASAIGITYQGLVKRYKQSLKLCDKVKAIAVSRRGPEARLTPEWEMALVKHIEWQVAMGDPMTRDDVICMAMRMGAELGVECGGRTWVRGFERRQRLTLRRPQRLECARAKALTSERAAAFYQNLAAVMALVPGTTPECVWNMDETGLEPGNTTPCKVVCPIGTTNLVTVTTGDRRHVSAVVCGNAAGELMNTMLLYPKSYKSDEDEMKGWPEAMMRFGESAYMDDAAWSVWVGMFIDHITAKGQVGKAVLILDQHSTRFNLVGLLRLAKAGVRMMLLPAHTTSALQPLDVCVFKSMKAAISAHVKAKGIHKLVVSTMVRETLSKATAITLCTTTGARSSNLIKGFSATGILPYNPDAVASHCIIGDRYQAEIQRLRAIKALTAASAAGGAGTAVPVDDAAVAAAIASAAADAAAKRAAALAVKMAGILMPSAALIADLDVIAAKEPREAAADDFATGAGHLAARRGKKVAAAEAAKEKEDKKVAREEKKQATAEAKAAHQAEVAARRAARVAAKAAMDAAKEKAATKATHPATAAAAAAAAAATIPVPPAAAATPAAAPRRAKIPHGKTLKAAAPHTDVAAAPLAGTKRRRGDTAVDTAAVGAPAKRR